MSLTALLNQPVTIVRRFDTDSINDYGDAEQDEVSVETVGSLQQSSRSEPGDQGEFSVTEWRLFLPADAELTTSDYVIVDEFSYELVGDPWQVRSERLGTVHHVEATVKRTGEIGETETPGLYPSDDLYPG